MQKIRFIATLAFVASLAVLFADASAQTRKKRKTVPKKTTAVGNSQPSKPLLQCTTQNAGKQEMTYLVGAGKLSRRERRRIEEKWGKLIVPQGETERAKEIRQKAIDNQKTLIEAMKKSLETWRKANPNATTEQIEEQRRRRDERIDFKINNNDREKKKRIAAKSWDWRSLLDVRAVLNQGQACNTCWAFAASDAAALSIQKNLLDTAAMRDYVFPNMMTGELANQPSPVFDMGRVITPFVQDLLNCMPIPAEEICRSGWHGRAFDFMVYGRGMPVTYEDGFVMKDGLSGKVVKLEYKPNRKFTCQPSAGFQKAASWDYVNSPPDKLPTVEQLKTALIEHGPLVAPIFYDECLAGYKGGVFNEQNMGVINHVVLLVGWDEAKQAWLVKNSWGSDWGENGFAWIKYGSNNIGVFAAWIDAAKD